MKNKTSTNTKTNTKILLIIPAYNEEESILSTYKKIADYNKDNNTNYDVIVINDGSTDKTEKILRDNNIPHLQLKQNLGIGGAVQTGYKYAHYNNYDIAIQYDGDGQHDVSCVKDISDPIINNQADMVIGSRFVPTGDTSVDKDNFQSSAARRAGINLISSFIKTFTGKKIYDTTSGFRAANHNIIKCFAYDYPHEYPEPVSTTKVLKLKYKVAEVPAKMNERAGGTSSINSWKTVYYMINVCFSIILEALGGYKHES